MKSRNLSQKRTLQVGFLILFFSCRLITFAQWTNVGNTSISNSWTTYNDIAIDTSDAPVVILNEASTNLKCLKYNGIQWQDVGLSSFNFPFGGNTQLSIDSVSNTYYISYSDINNNYSSVIKFDGSAWTFAGSQYIVNQSVNEFVMAIDNSGVLYCAFISTLGFQLFKDNGNTWQQITTTGLEAPIAHIAITFDNQNNLLMAFTNMNNMNAGCMKLNGTVWQQLGNANITTGAFAQYNKIKVSNTNEVYIATQNIMTCCYKLDLSNTWQQLGTSGLGFNYIGLDDFIIDSNNQPTIITSEFASNRANCIYFNGSNWLKSCGSEISDTTASSVAVVSDSHSSIYAIFNNYVGGNAYVRECASVTGINEQIENVRCKIYPNPVKDILYIDFDGTPIVKLHSIIGNLIFESKTLENINTIDISQLSRGVYYISVYDEYSHNIVFHQKIILI